MSLLAAAITFFCVAASAQLPEYQLNRVQEEGGLRTSDIINIAKDKAGFIWIASQGYVQQFDGRHTVSYSFDESVSRVFVDSSDRKWVVTRSATYLFDSGKRSFGKIQFENAPGSLSAILYHGSEGRLNAISGSKHYSFDKNRSQFIITNPGNFTASRYFGRKSQVFFFGRTDSVFRYDSRTAKLTSIYIRNIYSVIPVNADEVLVSTNKFETFHIDYLAGRVTPVEKLPAFDAEKLKNLVIHSAAEIENGRLLLSSNKKLLIYDPLNRRFHQPVIYFGGMPFANQHSVTALYQDETGTIFMNHADGLFFLGSGTSFIQHIRNYRSGTNEMASNDIRNIAEDEKGNIWIGTTNGIICLNVQNGSIRTYNPMSGANSIDFPSYRQVLNDGPYLWVGTSGHGVWVYDKKHDLFRRALLHDSIASGNAAELFNNAYVWKMLRLTTGKILTITGNRFYLSDPLTLKTSRINYSFGNAISRSGIIDSSGRLWHGTTAGLFCLDSNFKRYFRVLDSFPDRRIGSLCEWRKNRMLVGSKGLFEVVTHDNRITSFKRINAIPAAQFIYCMKQDRKGYIWMGTDDGIFRYDPVNERAIKFDRSDHVQSQAFNSDAAFLSSSGMIFMGGRNGLNYIDPSRINTLSEDLKPVLFSFTVNINDSVHRSPAAPIPYNSRNIDFIISAPEYKKPFSIRYRYRLREEDEWTYTGYNNNVRISRMQPGKYLIQVSASLDGNKWFDGNNRAAFTVLRPWWQSVWFISICVLAVVLSVWYVIQYRRRKRQEAEMKRLIDYFTYSGTGDSSVNSILWDITRNCISRLGFEDCVIYLLDREKNVLTQKAAYGGKSRNAFEIHNPIEIPVGAGITGEVAKSGTALIVNDTSRDPRYIVDDERRYSEITVPIIHDGMVIGVIDSENRKKNFFTKRHLETLQTISSLCASKIATASAKEAAKKAEAELHSLNARMIESRFMNLRLQMNPHFLFNILTSIQYLIVSNQVNKATRYLDIFSGFLRSLLNYAEENVVTLEEELRILGMYVELESLCLDETFVWEVQVDDSIDQEDVFVPFMLLQPFVENAINHGLIHKTGEKKFTIEITEKDEESLVCIIEDNGIGRTASGTINRKKLANVLHESKGIGIVEQRLELLQRKTSRKACFEIEDIYKNGQPAGTRVTIEIPYYSKEEI